jgi:hypothetical protein
VILAKRQVGDAWRATPTRRRFVGWVARGQAGPPPLVVGVAAPVTPCRHAGATVLDKRRQANACRSAAGLGGDVGSTDQIPVPLKPTAETAEPAVGAAPLPQPPVLHPARILLGDASGVANHQHADLPLQGERDYLFGGLMLSLVHTTAMACLDAAQASPVATPTPGAALSAFGCAADGLGLPGRLIHTVQVSLGAERPPRDKQADVLGHHRVGMDDAKVHSRHPARVQVAALDGDGRSDRQPQPPTFGQQRDRPDLLCGGGEGTGQPHPQLRAASCDWHPHPLALDSECAVVEPDGDQGALRRGNPALPAWPRRLAA